MNSESQVQRQKLSVTLSSQLKERRSAT